MREEGTGGDPSGLMEVKCHEVGVSRQATAPARVSSQFPAGNVREDPFLDRRDLRDDQAGL